MGTKIQEYMQRLIWRKKNYNNGINSQGNQKSYLPNIAINN